MFRLRFMLLLTVTVSIVVSVHSSAAVVELTQKIHQMKNEIKETKKATGILRSEINNVEGQLDKLTKIFESKKVNAEEKIEEARTTLKQLTLLAGRLIHAKNEQNSSYIYLKGLSESIRYSLGLIKQDFDILKNRREGGEEEKCYYYSEQEMNLPSAEGEESTTFRMRSISDDTAEILLLVAEHDIVKSELFAAIHERDRLQYLLKQKKELLAGNTESFQDELNEKLKAERSVQERVKDIKKLVKNYKSIVRTLKRLNKEMQAKVLQDQKEFSNYEKLLKTEYRRAVECYKGIVPKTQSHFQKFFNYKKSFDETVPDDEECQEGSCSEETNKDAAIIPDETIKSADETIPNEEIVNSTKPIEDVEKYNEELIASTIEPKHDENPADGIADSRSNPTAEETPNEEVTNSTTT